MTEELFREDAYLKTAAATVRAATPAGIVLDRTIFYPAGGGQPRCRSTTKGLLVPVSVSRCPRT